MGVPAECTFGTFVFERSCDLVAVLLLSLFIVSGSDFLLIAVGFVLAIVGGVLLCALKPGILQMLEGLCERLGIPLIPRALAFLQAGVSHCRGWLGPVDMMVGLVLGVAAWAVVGLSFVYLLSNFSSGVPFLDALSIYPLSMLVGAASMIPGGVGTTEGAMVLLLGQYGFAVGTALLLAVVIRIVTLWFGVLVGFCALAYLEFNGRHNEGELHAEQHRS
nr:lysylphosphatidylglycerol synthase transmembrane domain-containing protein [Marinobacter segnicrescens]